MIFVTENSYSFSLYLHGSRISKIQRHKGPLVSRFRSSKKFIEGIVKFFYSKNVAQKSVSR